MWVRCRRAAICSWPTGLVWIVPQEGHGNVVLVQNRDPSLQFRNHGIVTPKAHLARPPQMEGDVAHKFAVEIEMAQPAVFPVANQQERLIVARVHGQPMAAVAQAIRLSLAGIGRPVFPALSNLKMRESP